MNNKLEADARRVLVCEDDRDIAALLLLLLEQSGLAADVARDAAQAKSMLAQNDYAAMTLDLTLPDQDGIALLRELRAAQRTAALPILAISAGAVGRRAELGGEAAGMIDWIDKPIDREQLAAALMRMAGQISGARLPQGGVAGSSRRGTGVLDLSLPDGQDSVKDQLEREAARAKRMKTLLSLAMVDIDQFGKINDAYGYAAGNRVVQALAHLLRQRLRKADLIGRYGGEEFAIILSDTGEEAALKVMDNIREDFSRLRHVAEGKEFFVTFSCGIAGFPRFDDAAKLGAAAEKALYQAKRAGRNRVVLAQEPHDAADDTRIA